MTSPSPIPEYLARLVQLVEETPKEDHGKYAKFFGLPSEEDCPRPGEARGWEVKQWEKWSMEHGYFWKGEATHAFMWEHKLSPRLIVSTSKTTGDFRSWMAVAMQVRRLVREVSLDLAIGTRMVVNDLWHGARNDVLKELLSQIPQTEEGVKDAILKAVNEHSGFFGLEARLVSASNSGGTEIGIDLWRILDMVQKEFGVSPRNALMQSTPEEVRHSDLMKETYEGIIERRRWPETISGSVAILNNLKDWVEYQRELRKAEKEAKRAAREEREADKQPTVHEQIEAAVAAQRREIFTQVDNLMKSTSRLLEQARTFGNNVPKLVLPPFEDPQHLAERLSAAESTAEAAQAAQVSLEAENAGLRAEVARLTQEAAKGKESPAASFLRDFAKQIQSIIADTDFTNVGANLKRIKTDAIAAEAIANEMITPKEVPNA